MNFGAMQEEVIRWLRIKLFVDGSSQSSKLSGVIFSLLFGRLNMETV